MKFLKDVWEYYFTTSTGRNGKRIIVIHAVAPLKRLKDLGLDDESKIKQLWLSALSEVPSLSKKSLDNSLFEIDFGSEEVEVRITLSQEDIS